MLSNNRSCSYPALLGSALTLIFVCSTGSHAGLVTTGLYGLAGELGPIVTGLVPVAGVLGLVPVAGLLGLVPVAGVLGLVPVAGVLGLVPVAGVLGLVPVAGVLGLA